MSDRPIYLIVTPFFPSQSDWTGGFCLDFAKAVLRTGLYDVRVLKPGISDYAIEGIKVTCFKVKMLPSSILPFFYRKENEESFLSAVAKSGVRFDRVVICHAHTATYGIYPLAIKRKNPNILSLLHHHDPQSFGLGGGVLRHYWPYNMWLFSQLKKMHEQIDWHVYVSYLVKMSFESAPNTSWTQYDNYKRQMRWLPYKPVHVKRSIVLHNGVDAKIFKRRECMPSNKVFTVGFVANFVDWKDPLTLLKAIKKLNDSGVEIHLRMLGGDDTLGRLQRVLGRLSLKAQCHRYVVENNLTNVEFCSEVPHEQLTKFFSSLDLFIVPSYFEGFGCVFTEAYACGVPFCCCQGQGISEIAPLEWQVAPGDIEGLVEKIKAFMYNKDGIMERRLTGEWRIDPLVKEFLCSIS